MASVKGKDKGNKFERDIAKKLSLFLSEGKADDWIIKTRNSGGLHTTRAKQNLGTYNESGDLKYHRPEGRLFIETVCIECKAYSDIGLWSILTGNGKLIEFWEQSKRQAAFCGQIPVLICKQNFKPILWISDRKFKIMYQEFFDIKPKVKVRLDTGEYIYIWLLESILDQDPVTFNAMLQDNHVENLS